MIVFEEKSPKQNGRLTQHKRFVPYGIHPNIYFAKTSFMLGTLNAHCGQGKEDMMRRFKIFIVFIAIFGIICNGTSYAQPKIPKENIPDDILADCASLTYWTLITLKAEIK